MAELRVRLDIGFSRASLRWTLVASLLAVCAPELGSETVTLSTYYPAPSGVYTKMITTQDTWLARDSGKVGIGTQTPAAKLDVYGTVRVGNFDTASQPAGAEGAIYYNTTDKIFKGYRNGAWMDLGGGPWTDNAAGGTVYVTDTGRRVGIGTTSPATSLDVSGIIMTRQSGTGGTGGSCTNSPYTIVGTTYCPGGTYATTITGLMSKRQMMPLYQVDEDTSGSTATGQMWCCQCPTGGCPSL